MVACAKQASYGNVEKNLWRPWESQNICHVCQSEFKRVGELKRHKSTHFPKIRVCRICNEQFTRKDNLTRHMKSKHDDNFRPSCEYCNKLLSRQDSAARHQRTCHKNPARQRSISPAAMEVIPATRPNVIVSVASYKNRSQN